MAKDRAKKFEVFIAWLQFGFNVVIIVLIVYLFLIQVVDIRHYRDRAERQRMTRNLVLRGEILDRNGIKLATTNITYHVYAQPKFYDHTPKELAKMLSPILGESVKSLEAKLSQDKTTITLKKNLDRKSTDKIKALKLREITFDTILVRTYPQGSMASHVLGFYSPDSDISAGIEYSAKDILTYSEGMPSIEKTPKGDVIYNIHTNPEDVTKPFKGSSVILTIDSAIQHVCEQELYKMIKKKGALRGAVVALEPSTGEILAFAVYPYYDPNNYGKASLLELKNWALTDVYPPGSTFKVLTVASAMELGKINKNSLIEDSGKIKLANYEIKNYDYSTFPHPGLITLKYLFQHSSNVGAVKVARMMSVKEFYDMLWNFGMGQKTGVDLPGESSGILPAIRTWEVSRHGNMGMGYGTSTTVLQMAAAVSAIANKGVWITPHIMKYTPEQAEEKIRTRRVLSEYNAKALTQLLYGAINDSKSVIKMDNYNIAAKTGTSLRPKENGVGYTNKMYTSIVGFMPATDPKVLIYVVVDSPSGEAVWGSTVAAPVFKEISIQVARIMNLKPDKEAGKNGNRKNNRKS